MVRRDIVSQVLQFFTELQQASGISGGESLGVRIRHTLRLAFSELVRGIRLNEVVNSSRAATAGVRQFEKFQPRDSFQEITGRTSDALRVQQMAGVLVSDA